MKIWRWLREAIAPKGPPVFLVGAIAFLISFWSRSLSAGDRLRRLVELGLKAKGK